MHSTEIDSYIRHVLRQVHFFPDHKEIQLELETHIADCIVDYEERGFSREEAEQLCLRNLGDSKVVGKELNRVHNPLIGCVYSISQLVMVLMVAFSIYLYGTLLFDLILSPLDKNQSIKKDTIVATLDIDETATIDDDIYHFYRLIYDTNGDLHILWTSRNRYFLPISSRSPLGKITDESGTEYLMNSSSSGGLINYHRLTLENYNPESQTLYIDYDYYNRSFHLQFNFPENWMKEGDLE